MKIEEMINALRENNSLKFIGDNSEKVVFAKPEPFCIGYKSGYTGAFVLLDMCQNDLLADWELVREPVDFITAVNSGKDIKPIEKGISAFEPFSYWQITLERINGKWYIE